MDVVNKILILKRACKCEERKRATEMYQNIEI